MFTLDQHQINKLYVNWKQQGDILIQSIQSCGFPWPVGLNAAYDYYLNYKPYGSEAHGHYWDQYVHAAWKLHNKKWFQPYYEDEEQLRNHFTQEVLHHNLQSVIVEAFPQSNLNKFGFFTKEYNPDDGLKIIGEQKPENAVESQKDFQKSAAQLIFDSDDEFNEFEIISEEELKNVVDSQKDSTAPSRCRLM
jgi:hypothetical protein